MLRTNPTRIDLKSEDLREYEEIKKMWPKNTQNTSKSSTVYEFKPSIDSERKTRNTRIGLSGK